MARHLLIALLVAAGILAATAWPRLSAVETGRTPEYPELTDREYAAGEDAVLKAAQASVEALPRWSIIGSGRGPGGSEVRAVARTLVGTRDDVTVRIRRQGGRTRVSVRSQSRTGLWDFGQNARNVKAFLAELDRQLALRRGRSSAVYTL